MNSKAVSIWGREFDLKVSYDHYDDDVIPEEMKHTRDAILSSWSVVDSSLDDLKRYCLERDHDAICKLYSGEQIDNIFRIVMPDCLFVLSSEGCRRVALMLDYRFDPEEGVALLFENEELVCLCPQSSVF